MPFGVKNVGAMYQYLVNKLFEPLIARTKEIYVDDMIVKSMLDAEHGQDLRSTFDVLQTYEMKLKLKKCMFGVQLGKFLGFMISNRGIEPTSTQFRPC